MTGAAAEVGSSTFRALRVQSMPIEYGDRGVYGFSWLTGSFSPGILTDAPVWSFRWSDAARLCVLQDLVVDGIACTGAFAVGFNNFRIFFARSFTANDTGGTAFTLTNFNGKRFHAMPPTILGDLRGTNTIVLSAGTRTLDAQPLAALTFTMAVANTIAVKPGRRLLSSAGIRHADPVVMAQNEGLVATMTLTASGTVQVGMTSTHAEVAAY